MAPPETFGPYEIVRRLGVGGMAEVFVAVRRGPAGFEQEVCLKRILAAYADDEIFQKMFLTEARIAARVRHANIVQVYDFGEADGTYYLALELVEGTDLRHLLHELEKRGERLEIPLVAWIAHQTLSALSCVHGADDDGAPLGLVHRDLSPSNVLISRHGELKLADFGVAKATKAAATASGAIKGKPSYMPVEQLELDADPRSDLFALGVMMYEMIAAVRPFDGPTDVATMQRVMRGTFTPLKERAPEVPDSLAKVVDRLLSRNRADRYQTAEEVLDAIVEHVPPPTARRKLAALVRRVRPDEPEAPNEAKTTTQSSPAIELARGSTLAIESAEPKPMRGMLFGGVALAAAVVIALAIAAVSLGGGEPPVPDVLARADAGALEAPDAGGRDAGAADAGAIDAGAIDAGAIDAGTDAGAIDAGTDAAASLAPAVLTVRVRPYGFVWINGARVGKAPVVRRVPAGSHTVAAGANHSPVRSRTVTVAPGQRTTVAFDVPAE
jgi:serine/threonine protein kinase